MNKKFILVLFTTLFAANAMADDDCCTVTYPTNKDGSVVTGIVTADFNPSAAVTPIPFNLFFLGTTDLTLNPPVDDPTDYTDPLVALSALDGFSTTEKWVTTFTARPFALDTTSIKAGQNVRLFEVSTVFGTIVAVSGIVRELTPGLEYVAVASGRTLAIVPTSPLKEMTTYMAVLTNGIKDTRGNDATPDQTYYLSKRATPWVDAEGHSTYSLVNDATAASLESLRKITLGQETAAASVGIPKEDIILSWTAQTQSITPVLKNLRSIAMPAPTTIGPTGMSTAAVGGKGAADLYAGIITLPYYLGVPSAANPTAPIFDFWKAEPGGYVAPFDALGLDPTSTNVTVANPFPMVTSMQTVPVLMSVPNAASGHTKPAAGWPVVIFAHGLGGNRSNMLGMADTAAAAGYAVIAIDAPMHGIRKEDSNLALLYIENTPFAGIANERTFDVDYINNSTGALVPDGVTDPSGAWAVNLISLLTQRDNYRQAQADFSVLAVTVPTISIDGDALADLDGSTIQYVSISGGSVLGPAIVATEPMINNAFMSVGGGGIARLLNGSAYYGPNLIQRQLKALAGIEPGMPEYELYLLVWQTVVDSADPINWSAETARFNNIVVHEVINDQVVPNSVPGAPLSGTEPMIRAMGLKSYSSTQTNPNGLDIAGRFVAPASHGSLLDPTTSPAATQEMQKQLASFLVSKGKTVAVENAATMVPAAQAASQSASDLKERSKTKTGKRKLDYAKPDRLNNYE